MAKKEKRTVVMVDGAPEDSRHVLTNEDGDQVVCRASKASVNAIWIRIRASNRNGGGNASALLSVREAKRLLAMLTDAIESAV